MSTRRWASVTVESDRRPALRTWVVKLGSALLTCDGKGLDERAIQGWVDQIEQLRAHSIQVVLVSSGAIAEGLSRLALERRPEMLHELQALAAIGQMGLVQVYERAFQRHGTHTAQVLLTHDDVSNRRRYLNARSTLRTLLGYGVVPVVNENDTVATNEIRVGDNDTLAGLVANLVEAESLVILTDQNGLFTADPRSNFDAQLVSDACAGDPTLEVMAGGSGALGRGGMLTKLRAAALAARSGATTYIVNGRQEQVLTQLRDGKCSGTRLRAASAPIAARKQWLAGLVRVPGAIEIDAGYAPAWLWRGTWLLDMDRPGEAITAFEHARTLGADSEASFGRARVLIAQEKYADAVPLLEPLARDSAHPYIYRTLGYALRALGRMEEARTALAQGRDAAPLAWQDERMAEKATFVRGIGRLSFAENLLGAGQVDRALEILETMRREQPDETCAQGHHVHRSCTLLNTLSTAYARVGRDDEAFALVKRGLSINPDFYPFHLNIAGHYRQRRELDEALHHIERAIALNPSLGNAHVQRGRLLIGLGRHDEATTALKTALQFEPEQPATLLYLGMAEGQRNQWSQAIEHLKRAIRLDPEFALGHVYLARSLAETGRIDEAWHALRTAERSGAPGYELLANERRLKELESAH